MARIAVVGAGVIGVTSAYLLARAGHEVTLIDASNEAGRGASAGNAAQLSWAYGDAMASPALLRHLPAVLAGRDPAFRIRWQFDADFLRWGLRFLANSSQRRWWSNTCAILKIADQSRRELAMLLAEVDLSFDYRIAGKLHLYSDRVSFAAAGPGVERKKAFGLTQRLLGRGEAEEIEPALASYQSEIAGAVFTPDDALGDAAAFCRQLTSHMVDRYGVEACFGQRVVGFAQRGGRLDAIRFDDRENLAVEMAVVAAGPLIRTLAADLPEARSVRPVRGYSLTMPWIGGAPRVSLTDVKRKLAFAAIGEQFRVAGLADMERPGSGFDADRLEALRASACTVLPQLFDRGTEMKLWSGERPMTPSSQPIICPSRHIRGVYVNVGHGMLGWTLALGSARRLVGIMQ